jgi:hypothetical protein
MADELVTIASFADAIEANLAKQMLADFQIKSIVSGENTANVYSGLVPIVAAELQVLASDAERATEILESQKQQVLQGQAERASEAVESPDKLVTIATFADAIEANLAKQLLDDFGIKAMVSAELQVLQGQAERAAEILGSQSQQED